MRKLTKMADLAKIRHGFGKLDDTVASWRVANMTKIVKPASNGENGESGEKSPKGW